MLRFKQKGLGVPRGHEHFSLTGGSINTCQREKGKSSIRTIIFSLFLRESVEVILASVETISETLLKDQTPLPYTDAPLVW